MQYRKERDIWGFINILELNMEKYILLMYIAKGCDI